MRAACCEATVLRHEVIADDIRLLTALWPDREHAPHAGQFFTLRAWGADEAPFLSRPISVHRWNPDSSTIEFLYQVVGEGTEKLAQLKQQDTFQLTGPMGNGFDVPDILSKYKKIAVVGGGIAGLEAARVAAVSGIPTVLTCASNAGPAMMGDPVGTVFAPVKARGSSRRLWIGFAADPRGTIVVDAGAGQAIRGGRASLLAAGALEVHGYFSAGDPVWIDAESCEHLARGLAGFDSEEIPQMLGRNTAQLKRFLGPQYAHPLVHRDNLVLV